MPMSPPPITPRLMPRLSYCDAEVALEFLGHAFGFRETGRVSPGGTIAHAEMELEGQTIVAVCQKTPDDSSRSIGVQLLCYVDDVDAHFQRSRMLAEIISEPSDQLWGDRSYDVRDCGGYHWTFRQRVKDVALEEIKRKIEG